MPTEDSSKNPTDFASGLEKQVARQQQVKTGSWWVMATPNLGTTTHSGLGGGGVALRPRPHPNPNPGPPPHTQTSEKRNKAPRGQVSAPAGWPWPCALSFLTRRVRPGLHGRLRPGCGLGTPAPQLQGNYLPFPTRPPAAAPAHAGYLRSGRRTLPPPGTCRLRGPDRAPALRGPRRPPARPRDPPQLTSLAGPTLRRAEHTSAAAARPARLPPGRPRTSGVADSARRHFRLLRPARSRPVWTLED